MQAVRSDIAAMPYRQRQIPELLQDMSPHIWIGPRLGSIFLDVFCFASTQMENV